MTSSGIVGQTVEDNDSRMKKPDSTHGRNQSRTEAVSGTDLWTDGLICAFEYVRGRRRVNNSRPPSKFPPRPIDGDRLHLPPHFQTNGGAIDGLLNDSSILDDSRADGGYQQFDDSRWVPIGWNRISELVQNVQVNDGWASQQLELIDSEADITVADLAAPYWERPAGPMWWCHVDAGHRSVQTWFTNAQWLHPAISLALRDESRLISEKMKHLLYEVPVRVAGGLLFELLGQSAGDPFDDEDDIPVVLRSWQAQNFLVTSLHVKGQVARINVLGLTEVQELLSAGGYNTPRTVHEVIAQLACRLTRWDDRLFRKSIFGAADEVELMFVNRRNHEDMHMFGIILNQEIRKLSRQVIRVKWSLHAREEIIFELIQHLKGNAARSLLDQIRKNTREMIEEQEADRSLRVTHNLAVFGGCGLVLSIITGLFGINVDGIPGSANTPYAFGLFTVILFTIGIVLIVVGLIYLGLKNPINEERVEVRKMELDELVKMFQHEAETHGQVRNKGRARNNLTPTTGDKFSDDIDYVLIQ
ncbi:hypothetical protein LINGRAHAP2_LOCUS5744 [Linum grandiflorum]